MQASRKRDVTASLAFPDKSKAPLFAFCAGEEVVGTAFVKLARPMAFKEIHVCFVGRFVCRNGYNAKAPAKDTSCTRFLAQTGQSYAARNGDDKVTRITVPLRFPIPLEAVPSFSWTLRDGKPGTETSAMLTYEMFVWVDVDGHGRDAALAPDDTLRTTSLECVVVAPEVAPLLGLPAVPLPGARALETRATTASKKHDVEASITIPQTTVVVSHETSAVSITTDFTNRHKKKAIEGLLLLCDEIVTIQIGAAKPVTFHTNVIRCRLSSAEFFCDALKSNRCKRDLEVTLPRGNDAIGCPRNITVATPSFHCRHVISAEPIIKGVKEGDIRVSLDVQFGSKPVATRQLLEYNI